MLNIGMFLGNRYEIIGKIGSGGMSDVYKAKCHKLNRYVAIKVLKQEFSTDQSFVSKFRMEAQSAACLSHPSIVNIYDVGEENGIYYIVMELIEGITLKKYIDRKRKLEIRESIEVAMQVARGLEAAHAEHIIHRDIKPQNIMISREGKVKVTDFGIARAASTQTISSNTMGSVHYISPEQARGGYCDERSDIYSLGISLYEMLTGRVPFEGDSTVAVALLHIQGEMVPPREYEPLIPISLEKIILKCTQKKPEMRYASATELIEDLKKSLTMPNEDFVKIVPLTSDSPTMIFSGKDVEQIKKETARARIEQERQAERKYQMGMDEEEEIKPVKKIQDEDDEYEEDDDTDARFEKIITYIGIGIAVLIVLVAGAFGMKACGVLDFGNKVEETTTAPEQVDMIDLLGKTYEEANQLLEDLGLTMKATYEPSETYPDGQVFEQDVEVGTKVVPDTVINVKISTGVDKVAIPSDLAGKTAQDATSVLLKAGFTNVAPSVIEENHESIAVGSVIRTEPAMGTPVEKDALITLVVSKGPAVVPVEVPDLTGMTEADARNLLANKKLTVGAVDEGYHDTIPAGKIIEQSPESTTVVEEGAVVNFTISKGSEYVEVPNLLGYSKVDAEARLEAVGLKIGDIDHEYSDADEENKVISQENVSGEKLKRGSSVNIIIGLGPEPTQPETTTTAPETTTASPETTTTAPPESSSEDQVQEPEPDPEAESPQE